MHTTHVPNHCTDFMVRVSSLMEVMVTSGVESRFGISFPARLVIVRESAEPSFKANVKNITTFVIYGFLARLQLRCPRMYGSMFFAGAILPVSNRPAAGVQLLLVYVIIARVSLGQTSNFFHDEIAQGHMVTRGNVEPPGASGICFGLHGLCAREVRLELRNTEREVE